MKLWMPRPMVQWWRRGLLIGLVMLAGWTIVGTLGFVLVEDWSISDALYMSVITISTVGYGEVHPLSPAGRLFASFLIVAGLGTAFYTLTQLGQVVLEGELIGGIGRRRMRKGVKELSDHYILCGFGRVARPVAEELDHKKLPFCVIENDARGEPHLQDLGYPYLLDDATSDEALVAAGVERARAVLALLPSDAENLYVIVTAKSLNPGVRVISRASEERGASKLSRAGASEVVSPYDLASHRLVQAAASPTALHFMEHVFDRHELEVNLGEARVRDSSPLAGRSIGEIRFRNEYGIIVVAIQRAGGEMVFNPGPTEALRPGDILVAMGNAESIASLRRAMG